MANETKRDGNRKKGIKKRRKKGISEMKKDDVSQGRKELLAVIFFSIIMAQSFNHH